ncbi:coiled-coil domain-containing protein 110 isoform X1 [Carassius auratus]|uniref:Coiled-coil domain-containing protein 110 isoform X1 n=1 Tax=Carassius auratus TaxID=7957 RepID=A0A6P6N817_CARAU|nr:myosin-2 heavy chain, non muscle-like isoform X1 [Carassius auratus]
MEKSRFSGNSLPCGLNSSPAMQTRERGGDHVSDSKSQATTNLKETACLEEERKKENKGIKHEAGCAKQTRKCPFEAYLVKCTQLEKENLEVKKKLKKMEKYSRECKSERQRFVERFKEFKNINKDLDTTNKQLLIKNQQMRQRITEVLKQNGLQSEDLETVSCSEHREKQQLRETLVVLQDQGKNLTEPVRESQRMKRDSEIVEARKITQLQQENQTLRERLDHSSQVIKDAESRAERVEEQLDEAECCLLTVETERNLLRQEVKRLHQEYISLTNSISLQLKGNNKAAALGKPHHSTAQSTTSASYNRRHNVADKGSI